MLETSRRQPQLTRSSSLLLAALYNLGIRLSVYLYDSVLSSAQVVHRYYYSWCVALSHYILILPLFSSMPVCFLSLLLLIIAIGSSILVIPGAD